MVARRYATTRIDASATSMPESESATGKGFAPVEKRIEVAFVALHGKLGEDGSEIEVELRW